MDRRGGVRRWLRAHKWMWAIPASIVALAAGVGLLGWYVWLPGYRPSLAAGERYGIDVSSHQGHVDWSRVARSGIAFAYVKATEGSSYVDPDFASDVNQAKAAGLSVGAYHFFTLCSPGASQAANFLATVPRGSTALPPAVDLELPGNCAARPPLNAVEVQLSAFVDRVEASTGQPMIFYIGDSFSARYRLPVAINGLRWKRRFILHPSVPWLIWQVDGRAHVPGVSGNTDLDVVRIADLRAF